MSEYKIDYEDYLDKEQKWKEFFSFDEKHDLENELDCETREKFKVNEFLESGTIELEDRYYISEDAEQEVLGS